MIGMDRLTKDGARHSLKIDVLPMDDLMSGAKTGEVRRDDRSFFVGDWVDLKCADGRTASFEISHIQRGYGLPDEICVLSYRRASQAAPAPSDGLRGLVVKPLEWEGKPSDCYMQAESILGHYRIYVQYSDEWTCDFEPSSGRPVNVRCWATTPDDCKAAAQADHDARIRAALTPAPAQEGGRHAKSVCPICKGHSRFDQCSCHYEVKP